MWSVLPEPAASLTRIVQAAARTFALLLGERRRTGRTAGRIAVALVVARQRPVVEELSRLLAGRLHVGIRFVERHASLLLSRWPERCRAPVRRPRDWSRSAARCRGCPRCEWSTA